MRLKPILASTLIVFSFSVITSTASAFSFHVNGTAVKAGEKYTIAEAVVFNPEQTHRVTFDRGEAELSCSGGEIKDGYVEGESAGGAESLVLTGCVISKPAHCALHGGSVASFPARATLRSEEVTFKPLHGTVFDDFKFESSGGTCSLNGKEFKMQGEITGKVVEPISEHVVEEISFNTGAGELNVNGEEASLQAVIGAKLLLEKKWGIV